jgi:hypothetical protein
LADRILKSSHQRAQGARRLDAREIVDPLDQGEAARHLRESQSGSTDYPSKFFRDDRSELFRLLASDV